jgi:hypothetical protein
MDCHRRHIEHRSILSLNSRSGNVYDSVQRTACIQIYYPLAQRMDLVKERSERLVAALRHTCQLKFQTGGIRWVSYAYLPPFPQNMPEVQRRLAKASEYGLYALLLFQPVAAAIVGDDGVRAVLAARDMAAERRRAAALDGRHHLQLVEADVAGIGSAPRRSVVAEDIRNLQRWTGHDRRSLRRRLMPPALPGLLARLRQQIERALDAGDHAGSDPV